MKDVWNAEDNEVTAIYSMSLHVFTPKLIRPSLISTLTKTIRGEYLLIITTVSGTDDKDWNESRRLLFLLVLELYYDKSIEYLEVLRTVLSMRSIRDWMYEVPCTQAEDKLETFSRFGSLEVSNLVAGEQGSTSSNHLFYYYTQHTAQRSIIHISAPSASISLRSSSSMYEFIGILRYDDCFPLLTLEAQRITHHNHTL